MFSSPRLAAARARRRRWSRFFDFSIYIDAHADIIEEWYVTRFLSLKKTAFREPGAIFIVMRIDPGRSRRNRARYLAAH